MLGVPIAAEIRSSFGLPRDVKPFYFLLVNCSGLIPISNCISLLNKRSKEDIKLNLTKRRLLFTYWQGELPKFSSVFLDRTSDPAYYPLYFIALGDLISKNHHKWSFTLMLRAYTPVLPSSWRATVSKPFNK